MSAMTPMPEYICHKRVWALQIKDADEDTLTFVLPQFAPRKMHVAWMEQHMPQPGGYFVVYADGYESYSPQKAFEEGYSLDRTSTHDAGLLNTIVQAPPPKAEGT